MRKGAEACLRITWRTGRQTVKGEGFGSGPDLSGGDTGSTRRFAFDRDFEEAPRNGKEEGLRPGIRSGWQDKKREGVRPGEVSRRAADGDEGRLRPDFGSGDRDTKRMREVRLSRTFRESVANGERVRTSVGTSRAGGRKTDTRRGLLRSMFERGSRNGEGKGFGLDRSKAVGTRVRTMADPARVKRPEDLTGPPHKVKGSGFGQVAEPRPDRNRTESLLSEWEEKGRKGKEGGASRSSGTGGIE